MLELETIVTRYQQAEKEGLCPVCGCEMHESDRLREGDHLFIWLECAMENCDGQWLQKKAVFDRREVA